MQLQPDFSVEPHLASSVTVEGDRTYVLEIRDDVTFWDGTPMTPDDVVFSINRHLDPEEGSYWASNTTENIASVEQTDEWEVTIELHEPNVVFTNELATIVGVVVQEEHREAAGEDYGNPSEGVMCSGPYQVSEWNQGSSILLESYEDYWREDARALTPEVEINFTVDAAAISNSLATGEVHGGFDVPLSTISQLQGADEGELLLGEGLQNMAIISTGEGTFGDPAVRRALTRATDRVAVAETVFEGTAWPSESLIPAGAWEPEIAGAREDALPDLSHDIEAAQEILEDAEADLSEPITIAYPGERGFYADIINVIANGASEIGLTVEPVSVPSAQFGAFFSDPAAREDYDAFVTMNYLSTADALGKLNSIAHSEGYENYSDFSDPEIDALLEEAYATEDDEARAELVIEAEALVMEQQPWMNIVDLASRVYLADGVTGPPASFVYLYYPWAADLGASDEG
ncbi:ABC transporter substrate-binding protein [Nesterenkonia natronophila]|nr:ABC transporter substrate-binding protein [Nesterenkonia natronophila]